jgi:uncharacterized sporulation protein YeaH/YhbH (DUF444 family)
LSTIIDRRQNPGGKSLPNRQRFLRRAKDHLKEAVKKKIASGNVTDIIDGDRKVEISGKNTKEYRFIQDGRTGRRNIVVPGNKDFAPGDTIKKPKGGGGGGGKEAGGEGDYDDSFFFTLTRDELIGILFDDLELPDLERTTILDMSSKKFSRAGHTTSGSPSNLDVTRTMRNAMGRRIALGRPKTSEIEELEEELSAAEGEIRIELEERLAALRSKAAWVPFVDPLDTRYRAFEERPQPIAAAVMFCIMDVSGSMGEREKDIAKRFFMLLHLFLTSKYEKVSVVFIRHTTHAMEVDEHEFFYGTLSGGTLVKPAVDLASKIQSERFPTSEWNVYCAQVSDGGIDKADAVKTAEVVRGKLVDAWKYFAYIEIAEQSYNMDPFLGSFIGHPMVEAYDALKLENVKTKKVSGPKDIYPIFRELFQKQAKK